MGDYNPRSPTLLGIEVQPDGEATAGPYNTNTVATLQRIKPGAVTFAAVHPYLGDVVGNPGLGIEVVSSPNPPTRTAEKHFPGTDTGATKGSWTTYAGGVSTFSAIDDEFDDTDGLRNTAAVAKGGSIVLLFRGNDTALSGKRVDRVQIYARVTLLTPGLQSRQARIRGRANLSGNDYTADTGVYVPADGLTRTVKIADWPLNPSTLVPWTMANANALVASGASDEFGLIADSADIAATNLRVSGMWMVVTTAAENRSGFYYQNSAPRPGWQRLALTSPAALSAATWYWLLIYALRGSRTDYFTSPFLVDPTQPLLTAVGDTGEHRTGWHVGLTGPSGIVSQVYAGDFQAWFPFLLESAGPTFNAESQAYAHLGYLGFDATNNPANQGQEVTLPGGQAYAGVKLPLWWYDPNTVPDQPLVVELRTGAGMLTGGGTLVATATLDPRSNPTWPGINPRGAPTFIRFDGGNVTPSAGQHFLLVKSAASSGTGWSKGWFCPLLDSRSDNISTGAGTTQANVEAATFGGTTDSFSSAGTENDRYDLPIALVAPPAAPAGQTATVLAAL